ncbi:phosducin-like protein [Mercenaria mercenaria]|uniref:phosducin-like protein n=1 Tax=Mercenaria mercenaria TaxID=6596 RepID=UPI00234EBD5F|nr:phosducin-like protein [Mercenaria mercenaria]
MLIFNFLRVLNKNIETLVMALSLDDQLLGEKVENYCSSSEDEGEEGEKSGVEQRPQFIPENQTEYNGRCTNTGPKGVLNDWREFKRLETEQREEQERERQQLMKKLQITCRSHLNDEEEKKKDDFIVQHLDEIDEEFLRQYRKKRIEEMRKALQTTPKFGQVISLEKSNFIDAIDKEKQGVKVIVHVYEDSVEACESMNGCLKCLAEKYTNIKFCKIKATEAHLSKKFSVNGVPALLIYKNGDLIGNYIRLSDELGEDFYAIDVESFLQEHGMLPQIETKAIRDKNTGELRAVLQDDEESDLDVD